MKVVNHDFAVLASEAKRTLELLDTNWRFYNEFCSGQFVLLGETTASAMVFSQIFADFYTCIETLMYRISYVFENNLQQDKWHKELLNKMTLDIPSIRPAFLTARTADLLYELLTFRHFRRYYFSHDYDWKKIRLVEEKYQQVQEILKEDIQSFLEFLQKTEE